MRWWQYFKANLLQGSSQFIYWSYESQPVASTGEWMEVPYLPGHFYVNIPSDGEKGGQSQVTYTTKMPVGLDQKYPFFAVFKIPEVGLYYYKYCWSNPESLVNLNQGSSAPLYDPKIYVVVVVGPQPCDIIISRSISMK